MTDVVVEQETELETTKRTPLLIHIVKRDKSGNMEDETLCGKRWDHLVVTTKNVCPCCEEIAKRDNHRWRA